jgi:hypothetical protein
VLNLSSKAKKLKKSEINFMKTMLEMQNVACFFDEGIQEKQGNFARKRAIDVKGTSPPIELLRIKAHSTSSTVMNRLDKLVELSRTDNEEKELRILPDKKFNWIKEINRMKMTKRNRGQLKNSLLKVPKSSKKSVASSLISDSPRKSLGRGIPMKERKELTLNLEEVKTYSQSVFHLTEFNKQSLPSKTNKECKVRFYGSKGILAFLNEFMRQEDSKTHRAIILEEERNTLECLKQSLTMDSSPHNFLDEDTIEIDMTHSEGSIKETHNEPYVSNLVSSLIDIKDLPKICLIFNHDSLLLHFSQTQCLQFYLFLGFFYYKSTSNALTAIRMFIEAFKYVQGFATYRSYFPLMTFRSFILKLDLKTHKEVLNETGKIGMILNSVYQERITETSKFEEEVKVNLRRTEVEVRFDGDECGGGRRRYVNDYKGVTKLLNQDPNVVIVSALNDLITLLMHYKVKGVAVFEAARKSPAFKVIEKQAAGLKVIWLITNRLTISLRGIRVKGLVLIIVG